MRAVALLVVAFIVGSIALAPAPAWAIGPPVVPPGPPPSGAGGAPDPTEQKSACGGGTVTPNTDLGLPTNAEAMLNYTEAWKFSRGAGQRVAVIDTGVSRHPRLPALEAGGDFVSTTDGLDDCDAHGTLVAGIIAAAPSPDDGFAGVAPEATILSIRQNSGAFAVKGSSPQQGDPNAVSAGYGTTSTLARAIVRAVDMGATVINLSEVACAPIGSGLDDADLGRAVRFAYERNVVVVAAAGNFSEQGLCAAQNDRGDPNRPVDESWGSVRTIASPAWFGEYVLAVGSLTPSAEPSDFSLRGPWVDVAAPGERITSLDPRGPGLINAWQDQKGPAPINGTSFAAPFVSGVVALVRSRFPELDAGQVMNLVKRTARTPGPGPNAATGYGMVDPIAALTHQLPANAPNSLAERPVAVPARAGVDHRARTVVFAVLGVCLAASAVAFAVLRRRMD